MRGRSSLRVPFGWLAVLCAGFASLGCTRNAPGPEECARFAEMAEQLSGSGPLMTPQIQAEIDELTRQCLTKPYDRALLSCVEATRQTRGCLESFRLRTEQRQ
jgi:hypothetical protein